LTGIAPAASMKRTPMAPIAAAATAFCARPRKARREGVFMILSSIVTLCRADLDRR